MTSDSQESEGLAKRMWIDPASKEPAFYGEDHYTGYHDYAASDDPKPLPDAVEYIKADSLRCKHGVRWPHECSDCFQETFPDRAEQAATIAQQRQEIEALKRNNEGSINAANYWKFHFHSCQRERDEARAELRAHLNVTQPIVDALERCVEKRDALRARCDELREASSTLVSKIDEITEHPEYQGVWVMAGNHGMPYTGPTYERELAQLRAALQGEQDDG